MSAIRHTFLSNIFLVVGLNLLIKPIYILLVEAEIQERVGPDTFGAYFALLNISFLFNILPDLGITNWNTRYIAEKSAIDLSRLRRLAVIRGGLSVAYMALCLIVGLSFGYERVDIKILLALAFNQVLATALLFARSYVAGMHHFRFDSLLSVLDRGMLVAGLGLLLILKPAEDVFPIEYLIFGQTIAYTLALAPAIIFVIRKSSKSTDNPPPKVRDVFAESLPFATLILISMIANRQDAVLVERLHSSFEAGIYAMAFRISDTLNMFSFLFAGLLLPMFTRQLLQQKNVQPLFDTGLALLMSGVWTVTLLSIVHAQFIMDCVFDNYTAQSAEILPWVMLSACFFSLQYITGTLITASGKMRIMIAISACGWAYNTILNLFYIPEQGALGAAKAACFMQLLILTAQAMYVRKRYNVLSGLVVLRIALFAMSTLLAGYMIQQTPLPEAARMFILIAICICSVFLFKLMQRKELAGILSERLSLSDASNEKP